MSRLSISSCAKWAWSKSTRIKFMLIIDTIFFFVEILGGIFAQSLALTADAFHMLNDIISLVIGLWAVRVAQKATTDEFTFGWVRAEILGAFFNAVFLMALCVTIVLEALTRFLNPPELRNPEIVFIVGCAGLCSNVLGFTVLGTHGHGHEHREAEGHEPEHTHHKSHIHDVETATQPHVRFQTDISAIGQSGTTCSRISAPAKGSQTRRSSRSGHTRFTSIDDISIHPSSFRQDILAVASLAASSSTLGPATVNAVGDEPSAAETGVEAHEESPLLAGAKGKVNATNRDAASVSSRRRYRRDSSVHDGHHHTLPRMTAPEITGHSHADMGMRAMALHVLGDALGNVGVIVTALIILLADVPGKNYVDPAVSLFITAIILKTSIPLTIATARVLLQATPKNINIQEIRHDIERLPGVVSCHHIHVWQLSDTKVVASLHLQVSFPINTHSGEKYMELAKRARKCLHAYGIHSATIQPEFCLDQMRRHTGFLTMDGAAASPADISCLLACVDDCKAQGCCPGQESLSQASSSRPTSQSSSQAAATSLEPGS